MVGKIRNELNLLQKLYGFYNSVMDNVDSYYDNLWRYQENQRWTIGINK